MLKCMFVNGSKFTAGNSVIEIYNWFYPDHKSVVELNINRTYKAYSLRVISEKPVDMELFHGDLAAHEGYLNDVFTTYLREENVNTTLED